MRPGCVVFWFSITHLLLPVARCDALKRWGKAACIKTSLQQKCSQCSLDDSHGNEKTLGLFGDWRTELMRQWRWSKSLWKWTNRCVPDRYWSHTAADSMCNVLHLHAVYIVYCLVLASFPPVCCVFQKKKLTVTCCIRIYWNTFE